MRYDPVTEKPYCCVPSVLQMIQARRGLPFKSQDEIGWDLGLIVPLEIKSKFTKVRTGPEPKTGYGTQTYEPEFSIENYFHRNQLPLSIKILLPSSFEEMISIIELSLKKENDVVLCFNSRHLFGDGDLEHVSLIESYDRGSDHVIIIDPSIRAPKVRGSSLLKIFNTIQNHGISKNNGLWIISDHKYNT
jgi:hypothetical protein